MNLSASRAILRIARRNVARSRWRSALIALLVLLPVTGMSAAITILRTTTPTPEARATNAMGIADLLVSRRTSLASAEDLRSILPDGSGVEEMTWVDGRLPLPGRQLRVTERSLNLDGLARGMLTLVNGRLPGRLDEVAITPSIQASAELGVGDMLELPDGGRASIVGVVENPASINQRLVLRNPSLASDPRYADDMTWLVSIPAGVELPLSFDAINDVPSPDLGPNYTVQTRAQWGGGLPASATAGTLVVGALALIETVLVASAAFAVSIRRRQRELGILAASGAQPRQLAGTVVGEGLVLGGLAALFGAALGVAITVALSPWLDALTNRRNPPVSIDLGGLTLTAAVGLAAALLAAAIPAWRAARLPVLLALSGRRPPLGRARRILLLGLVLVGTAAVLVVAGAGLSFEYQSRDVAVALLVVGAIVGVLGFGACSPWLIERLEGIGRRLPTSARIAFRDTARARSRSAPIVTAMLSGMAATIAIAGFAVSYSAKTQADYKPWARPDQLIISGDDAAAAGAPLATELDAVAGAPDASLGGRDGSEASVQVLWSVTGPLAPDRSVPDSEWDYASRVTTGDATLLRALAADRAADALAAGKVIVLTEYARDIDEVLIILDRFDPMEPEAAPVSVERVVPAEAVAVGVDPERSTVPGAVLPRALVSELNLAPYEDYQGYLIRLDHPVTEADLSKAGAFVAAYGDTWVMAATGPDRTAEVLRWVAMALSLLLALSVTAIAVALGEAESRSDQRTLLALGAAPGIRRRIAAARAGVLAVLAGVLAIPAGLLPAWGLLASREIPLIVPINEILAAAILLPAAAIVGALLLSRPIPAWSAFRDTTSG
jgi:putative ABC transport system permease protein